MSIEIPAAELDARRAYKLMTGSVVPRPIAWVSTLSAEGVPNLAPFSYFNAVAAQPPTLLFVCSYRATDGGQKDTYHNVRATGEFVVNFVPERLAEAMNLTSVEAPPEVDEFERAGLTTTPSVSVKAPRVAESPIHFECKLAQIVPVGEGPGSARIIIGTVLHMHFDESVYREGDYIDMEAYRPLARLAGTGYARLGEIFHLARPQGEINPPSG